MNILILGDAGCGKDTFADVLSNQYSITSGHTYDEPIYGFVYEALKPIYGYKSMLECWSDRNDHRKEWFDLIEQYNSPDATRLARKLLEHANCYVGMRSSKEFVACKQADIFDVIIYIDASERIPHESIDSFKIPKRCADIIIENNGTEEEFIIKCQRFGKILSRWKTNQSNVLS